MAIRIPTYDAHVQLDSGAQTIPRYSANDHAARAAKEAGNALIQLGDHLRKRNEQFENFKMGQEEARAKNEIAAIVAEETAKFDPSNDPPGTLHNRIMARIPGVLQPLYENAPDRLKPYYQERAATYTDLTSTQAATTESVVSRNYYTGQLDKIASGLAQGVRADPKRFDDALAQITHSIDGAVNIPTESRRAMKQAYTKTLADEAVKGYAEQGRYDEGSEFINHVKGLTEKESQISPAGEGTQQPTSRNAQTAMKFFMDKGLSKADAAAFVWNFQQESGKGINPALVHDGGTGYGIAGFRDPSPGQGRRTNLFNFAGTNKPSLEQQLEFAWSELNGREKATLDRVKAATTPEAKAAAAIGYFRPAKEYARDRASRAGEVNRLLAAAPDAPVQVAEKPKVSVDPATGKMVMSKPGETNDAPPVLTADASGAIIGGVSTAKKTGIESINPTTQERALYQRHLTNLYGPGGVDHPMDMENPPSRSTLYQSSVEHDGKTYNIPTVWDGKILSVDEAVKRVEREGWDKFPSYPDQQTAEARYEQMHSFMERDTGRYFQERAAAEAAPKKLTTWGIWADTANATLEGARYATQTKDKTMVVRLKNIVASDIASITDTGKPVALDREMAQHFGTPNLSHELIASRLGEGTAQMWEEDRQTAQRVFTTTANMQMMPMSVLNDALISLRPQGGEIDYARRIKVFNAAQKAADKIIKDRLSDPAAAADQIPEVQAALQKVHANPADKQAAKDLVVARMKAQEFLEIPAASQSPVTNGEAAQIAAPLLDRANPNPDAAAKSVVEQTLALTGGDNDLARKALTKVLEVKGIEREKASKTAAALAAAGRPVPSPISEEEAKANARYVPPEEQYVMGRHGENLGLITPDDQTKPELPAGTFEPGKTMIPAEHIKRLREDNGLMNDFDATYGQGASQWVFDNAPASSAPTGAQSFDESGMVGVDYGNTDGL